MVNLNVLRSGLDLPLRATRDADLAVELLAIRSTSMIQRLRSLGYDNRSSSNRFDRESDGSTATIDILVPSYSNRHAPNLDAGEITVDGIPMLHAALVRPSVVLDVAVDLTDGGHLDVQVRLPEVVSAIALKATAYAERFALRDAEDLQRLLEVLQADGIAPDTWPKGSGFAAAGRQLSTLFDSPGRALPQATSSPQAQARMRAITRSIVGREATRR